MYWKSDCKNMCVDPVRIQIEFGVVPCFRDVLITAWNEKAIMAYTHKEMAEEKNHLVFTIYIRNLIFFPHYIHDLLYLLIVYLKHSHVFTIHNN